jgi:hypothetical protein
MALERQRLVFAAKRSLVLPACLLAALGVITVVQDRPFTAFLSGAFPLLVIGVLYFLFWLRRSPMQPPPKK